jgi:hypothetical protein
MDGKKCGLKKFQELACFIYGLTEEEIKIVEGSQDKKD